MVNNEILSFVREQTTQGKTKDEIRDMLVVHGGWDDKDVEEAFESLSLSGKVMPATTNVLNPAPNIAHPLTPIQNFMAPREPQKTMQPTPTAIPADEQFKKIIEPLKAAPAPTVTTPTNIISPTFVTVSSAPPATAVAPALASVTEQQKQPEAIKAVSPEPEKRPISIPPITPIVTPAPSAKISPILTVPDISTVKENGAAPPIPPENNYFAAPPSSTKEVASPSSAQKKDVATPGESPALVVPKDGTQKNYPNATVIKREPGQPPSPVFSQARKINISPVGVSRSPIVNMQKAYGSTVGRKILGFSMFLTGVVVGAVCMHAFLNGYFDPAISWFFGK